MSIDYRLKFEIISVCSCGFPKKQTNEDKQETIKKVYVIM